MDASGHSKLPAAACLIGAGAFVFYTGGFWLYALAVIAGIAMIMEYDRLWGKPWAADAICTATVWICFATGTIRTAPAFAILAALFATGLAANAKRKRRLLSSLAPAYIGMPILAFLYIIARLGPGAGAYIFVITAASDTAAWFAGGRLGGPKLAPSISPAKTWSGFLCGTAAASLCGAAFATFVLGRAGAGAWAGASLVLSIISAIGDLAESKMKRIAGVKDSSSIIPGHGGFLDRFDSFLAAAGAFAAGAAFLL
jgi:phosphatidate cytidylyltransferase